VDDTKRFLELGVGVVGFYVTVQRRIGHDETVPTRDGLDHLHEVRRTNGKARRYVAAWRLAPSLASELAQRNHATVCRFLGREAPPWRPLSAEADHELRQLLGEFPGLEFTARQLTERPGSLAAAVTAVLAATQEVRSA
jgi:hypothetical protein